VCQYRGWASPRRLEAAAAQTGIDGVIILRVYPDSPAAKAGLKGVTSSGDVEDVIPAANGQPIHDVTDLARIFEQIGVGKTVTLTVAQGDQSRQVNITLADVSRNQG
jgi:S1-C subfamily serine protease